MIVIFAILLKKKLQKIVNYCRESTINLFCPEKVHLKTWCYICIPKKVGLA